MKIHTLFQAKQTVQSLEVFPPKKEDAVEKIYQTLGSLSAIKPDFVSVTYGAGGNGQHNTTLQIAQNIKERYQIEPLHHLTCINNTKGEIQQILQAMKEAKVENVLALRGDLPNEPLQHTDFPLAKDLIAEIKQMTDFSVGAACYPEGHVSQLESQENIAHLVAKEQAGADFFISQLFFDNNCYYRMVDDARDAGVTAPIVAGIMPILSQQQVSRMIFMCGTSLPSKLIKLIHRYGEDAESLRQAGLEYALEQIDDLVAQGVDGVHLYTMNRPEIAQKTFTHLRKEHHAATE